MLLKVDQSLEESAPRAVAEAVGRLKVKVPPLLVIEKSVPVVEVARVSAPVCAVPKDCWSERTPVLVTLPFAYVRPEEKVVEATQVGVVPFNARTKPEVPAVVVATAPVPLPYGMLPACSAAQPVPPLDTATIPVTLAAVPPMFKVEVAAKLSAVPAEFE